MASMHSTDERPNLEEQCAAAEHPNNIDCNQLLLAGEHRTVEMGVDLYSASDAREFCEMPPRPALHIRYRGNVADLVRLGCILGLDVPDLDVWHNVGDGGFIISERELGLLTVDHWCQDSAVARTLPGMTRGLLAALAGSPAPRRSSRH